MFRSLFLAAALMALPRLRQTQVKSPYCHQSNYKLAIAIITVITGTVVTGATVTTGTAIMNGVKTAGGVMIMATIVAGISVKRMSVAIVKAGAIVTIIVEKAADMDTAIKHIRQWSTMPDATLARLIRPTNQLFNA